MGTKLSCAPIALLAALACGEPEGHGDAYVDELVELSPAPETSFGHDRLPEVVRGPPGGTFDVASLGCEGEIVVTFDPPGIVDGPGADLIVFENAFSTAFPEPGEVAVSEDGERWFTFPCDPVALEGCAGLAPTLALPDSGIDPRDPEVAGGDAFDLSRLQGAPQQVFYVRIRDRSREYWQSMGEPPWCDPGQQGAGGFDLDAIAAVHDGGS